MTQRMLHYKGYVGNTEYDPEADLLHGEVLGLRDVITFQGRTTVAIKRAFKESVDDYLTFCRERGEQPEKPYSGKFVTRIDPDLHRLASAVADGSGKSLNAWVSEQLRKAVEASLHPIDGSHREDTKRRRKQITAAKPGRGEKRSA